MAFSVSALGPVPLPLFRHHLLLGLDAVIGGKSVGDLGVLERGGLAHGIADPVKFKQIDPALSFLNPPDKGLLAVQEFRQLPLGQTGLFAHGHQTVHDMLIFWALCRTFHIVLIYHVKKYRKMRSKSLNSSCGLTSSTFMNRGIHAHE